MTRSAVVLSCSTPEGRDQSGRIAFVAGKKLGNAVLRSRAKRVLRAAAAHAGGPWPGLDVVLIARPATAPASSSAVAADIARAVATLSPARGV